MKVHGGACRPNGGSIPCEGQHMYFCQQCGIAFWTSSETRSEDTQSGRVYASPSYPACSPPHLKSLETSGKVTRARKLGLPGAPLTLQAPAAAEAPMPDIADAKKGA